MGAVKRKIAFVLLSIPALLLSGCWGSSEVNDLAIITAVGLDRTEDRQVELSVKIYLTSPSSTQQPNGLSAPSSQGPGKSVVRTVKGMNTADAASKLQQVFTRKVFWGQAEVFLFGEQLAKEGIEEAMDFLTRHPTARERANMFVSSGTAKEVLMLDPLIERSIADALKAMAKSQTGLNITMKELAQMMAGKSGAAVIPLANIFPSQESQEPFPFINGAAIFKNGKMIGVMDEAATRGILWLRNEVKNSTVSVTPENTEGVVTTYLIRNRTRLIPHIDGDRWTITVRMDGQDDIVENSTKLDFTDPKHIAQLEAELEEVIQDRVKLALTQAQKELKADIFQFADAFYRKYPRQWKQNKDRWDDIYPNVEVKLEANVRVARPGLTGKNIFKSVQR
jgi:spore germination protein KC